MGYEPRVLGREEIGLEHFCSQLMLRERSSMISSILLRCTVMHSHLNALVIIAKAAAKKGHSPGCWASRGAHLRLRLFATVAAEKASAVWKSGITRQHRLDLTEMAKIYFRNEMRKRKRVARFHFNPFIPKPVLLKELLSK